MSILTSLGLWFLLGSLSVVDPTYPPNIVLGGTVVAELHFVEGNVEGVHILSGKEPFVESCKSALSEWHGDSKQDADELVIVHFRQPNLFYLNDTKEEINPAMSKESLPYPAYIIMPSYPADALGQGSVVLRMDISTEGQVSDVQVVKPMGVLTDSSINAVRQWKFTPAEDEKGRPIRSHAYAVLVYQFPLIDP